MASGLSLRARQGGRPDFGRCIYIYNHVLTNQIIYSLTGILNNSAAMKQLTFYGKKTKPAALRKDMWAPFATVRFPDPHTGLLAMASLRHYRRLRDYCWTWKPTQAEIAAARQALEEDGTPVTFNMNLPSRKQRAYLLMDQKAYSVADLADVISRHEEKKDRLAAEKEVSDAAAKEKCKAGWKDVVDMAAEGRSGGLKAVEAQIVQWKEKIEDHLTSDSDKKGASDASGLSELKIKRTAFRRAMEAVTYVEIGEKQVPPEQVERWSKFLRAVVEEKTGRPILTPPKLRSQGAASTATKKRAGSSVNTPNNRRSRETSEPQPEKAKATDVASQHAKAMAAERRERKRQSLYVRSPNKKKRSGYTHPLPIRKEIPDSAVLIQWRNLADAEYASAWSSNVYHEWMGLVTSHRAPISGCKPVTTLALKKRITEEERELLERGLYPHEEEDVDDEEENAALKEKSGWFDKLQDKLLPKLQVDLPTILRRERQAPRS